MNTFIEIIGWIATALTISMYAPQTIKTIMHKKTEGLSRLTFLVICFGSSWYTTFGMLLHSWPVWCSNSIILLLMIPIIYYLFKDKKWVFIVVSSLLVSVFITTLVLLAVGVPTNDTMRTVAPIIAGICTSLPFIPQIVKLWKTKDVSSIAILSTFAIVAANALWVLYYLLRIITQEFTGGDLAAMLFSAAGVAICSVLAAFYYKYKK